MNKIHIGCGKIILSGWINVDLDSNEAEVKIDVRDGLPFESDSIEFIFSEHFVEHLFPREAVLFFAEAKRVLISGGVIRTAMPDLEFICRSYLGNWQEMSWIEDFGYEHIKTGAEMLNICFYDWEHRWLYDKEELERRLIEAGLNQNEYKSPGVSSYPELSNLERRRDSRLIVESTKDASCRENIQMELRHSH